MIIDFQQSFIAVAILKFIMKEKIITEGIITYKVLHKRSPLPYLLAGIMFIVYGAFGSIYRIWDYLIAAFVSYCVYAIARLLIWKDTTTKIELPPNTGDAQMDQLMAEARTILSALRVCDEQIEDTVVSACIVGIENKCTQILARLQEQPALFGQLRTFLRYYLPTTHKLLEARAAIEQGGMQGENAKLVCQRTDRVMPEIERAFEKQLEALEKHRYMDLQVEMDVLEGMIKGDGFSDL